jgi:hypothetical protein
VVAATSSYSLFLPLVAVAAVGEIGAGTDVGCFAKGEGECGIESLVGNGTPALLCASGLRGNETCDPLVLAFWLALASSTSCTSDPLRESDEESGRLTTGEAGPKSARENDGPERLRGLRTPSCTDAKEELADSGKSGNVLPLSGDVSVGTVGVGGRETTPSLGEGG